MRLTANEIERTLTAAWGRQAYVNRYRLAGNRGAWVAEDHNGHHLDLSIRWCEDGKARFELAEGDWPESPDPWAEALAEAAEKARSYFTSRHDGAALKRLPRALAIAETQNWQPLGDRLDTWFMPSQGTEGVVYRVNGSCSCPDYTENGVRWCKHRQARALAKCAAGILRDRIGAGDAAGGDAPVTEGPHEDQHSTHGQPQRIDVIVGYAADNARALPRINGNGQLVAFQADGTETDAPAPDLPELYRWLQEHGYTPAGFQWLGWEHGLRQRRQSYALQAAR
jgi:hypothetical protein